MDARPRLAVPPCLVLCLLAGMPRAQSIDPPAQVSLTAKVRDFKEANTLDPEGTHPHFNTYNACSAQEMGAPTVEDALDMGQPSDGEAFPGDERGPALRTDMPSGLARCFAPVDRFGDWFTDRDPSVNRSFAFDLVFTRDPASGLYVHKSASFFPLDNGSPYRKYAAGDPDPFGHLQTGTVDGKDLSAHNYGFTMEFHTRIVYAAGKGHRLSFQGDDDIWVFLNGRKVIDLGGVHQTQMATVDLDSIAVSLGLADGGDYPMDFYFAERHTASSRFMITANLHMGSVAIRSGAGPRSPAGFKVAAGTPVEIYDRGGRLVRSLKSEREIAADKVWDGKDASGRVAAPGLYLWRAKGSLPGLSGWVMNGGSHD
jgi:fibro-slime domain-containing protein